MNIFLDCSLEGRVLESEDFGRSLFEGSWECEGEEKGMEIKEKGRLIDLWIQPRCLIISRSVDITITLSSELLSPIIWSLTDSFLLINQKESFT